jgi:hypothetical protein
LRYVSVDIQPGYTLIKVYQRFKILPMKGPPREVMQGIASAGDAVIGTAVLAGFGAWGGMWLDDKFHTAPWLTVALALIGVGLGLARMVVKAMKSQ